MALPLRHELKFYITRTQYEVLSRVLRATLKLDPHAAARGGEYAIRSLYFDTVFDDAYFDKISGGTYDWNKIKSILVEECGWVAPDEKDKALHTSCKIERCKDHTQFVRFYHCKSKMIPFSALEFSLASKKCGRSREESLYEMEHFLGFSLREIPECAIMREFLEEQG